MKRQADGGSVTAKVVDQPETNGNKRIKLLMNQTSEGGDDSEERSEMDVSLAENSHDNNHEDYTPSVSKNNSGNEYSPGFIEPASIENNLPSEDINQNGDANHVVNSNCNGSVDEIDKMPSDNSESTVSELKPQSNENSETKLAEKHNFDDGESLPPVLSCCYDSIHNSESTDSFQSEGFEAENTRAPSTNVSENQVFQSKNEEVKESPVDSDVKKNHVDVDNLMLSHLKITELQGHSEIVHSIAADEDYVLSASSDTTVRVWSLERKAAVSTFSGHSSSVSAVVLLTPNQSKVLKKKMSLTKVSRIAITASLDCNIKLWSVVEGKELSSIYTYNGITCLGYLESECLAVIGTEGGKLELWDIASGKQIKSENAHEDAVTDIQIKDNNIYSVSVDGTIKVWSYEDEDIYPLYSRKRKEMSADKSGLKPAKWKTVAVSEDVLYIGDNTKNIKVLDWKSGRLRLFKNQNEDEGVCECVIVEKNMLFSSTYDSSSSIGAINVWKLPEMAYVCTITDADRYIHSLAVVQKENKLQIICGGHKLCIWEFDCSSPPSSETECSVQELENLGVEADEKAVEIKHPESRKSSSSDVDVNNSNNRWCNVM